MNKKAFIYIITAGVLWGTSGIFVKFLEPHGYTSLQLTALRGVISFIFFLIYAAIRDRKAFKITPKQLLYFAGIGASLFGTAGFYFMSLSATSISTAVVLMYSAPIYVTVFSALFLGEKFNKIKITALVMMIVGCALVSGIVGGLKFDALGIIFGIISGVSFASYNILTKICMQRSYSPISTNLYGSAFMSLIALIFARPAEIILHTTKAPLLLVPSILALGIITFVLPYFLYSLGMKYLPAGTVASLGTVEPLSACIFGIIMFDEKPSAFSLIGMILILLAVTFFGIAEAPLKKKNKTPKEKICTE